MKEQQLLVQQQRRVHVLHVFVLTTATSAIDYLIKLLPVTEVEKHHWSTHALILLTTNDRFLYSSLPCGGPSVYTTHSHTHHTRTQHTQNIIFSTD